MIVLKFGGTSVATASSIQSVYEIVSRPEYAKGIVVTVSALGGVTDELLRAANLASLQDALHKEVFEAIEGRHLSLIKALGLESQQLEDEIHSVFQEYRQKLEGIFILKELSSRIKDQLLAL